MSKHRSKIYDWPLHAPMIELQFILGSMAPFKTLFHQGDTEFLAHTSESSVIQCLYEFIADARRQC